MAGSSVKNQERRTRRRLNSPDHPDDSYSSRQLPSPAHHPDNRHTIDLPHPESQSNTPVNRQRPPSSGIQDEERNGIEIAAAALGQPERAGQVPFYTGTQFHFVFLLPIEGNMD